MCVFILSFNETRVNEDIEDNTLSVYRVVDSFQGGF